MLTHLNTMETKIAKKAAYSFSRVLKLTGCVLGIIATTGSAQTTITSGADTNTEIQRPARDDQPSLQLIQNYFAVTGGRPAHVDLKNVVATGTMKEAGQIKTFHIIETLDGRRQITYTWRVSGRPHKKVYSFDGVTVWSQELLPRERPANIVAGPEATHFKRQRWFIQPFIVPLRADFVFIYQGPGNVAGRPAHVVVGYGKGNERTWFYFDQESFLITRWGGLGPVAGTLRYLDYRATRFSNVGGILLPKEIDLLVDNGAFGSITFDSIKTNQDVDMSIFFMPPDTLPLLRQRPAGQ